MHVFLSKICLLRETIKRRARLISKISSQNKVRPSWERDIKELENSKVLLCGDQFKLMLPFNEFNKRKPRGTVGAALSLAATQIKNTIRAFNTPQ